MNTDGGKTDKQRVTKLAPILGRWKFETGRTLFEGAERADWPYGVCVSNIRFLDGQARVKIKRTNASIETRILLGYRSLQHEYITVGLGGGTGQAYSIVQFDPAIGWYALAGAGSLQNLPIEQPVEVFVKVKGQRIFLDVDGVRVLEHVLPRPLSYGQLGLFVWGNDGTVEFTEFYSKATRGDVFVVMQFSGFEELYTDVIEPMTKEYDLHAYRADQVYGSGSIIDDIIRGIETAQIVIAEITPTNENVFYEVGYAHALKKPTILLVDREKKEKLPFDLSGYRCLFYQNSIGGKRKVKEGLQKYIEAILNE